MTVVLAAVAAAAAGALLVPASWVGRPLRLPRPAVPLAAVAALLLVDGRISPVLVAIAALVVAVVAWSFRRRRLVRTELERGEAVLAFCETLAADLQAGAAPSTALASAVEEWPELRGVADAATLGADVPRVLRTLADRPGAGQLRLVAAAWVVAHRSGAGLASAVDLAARTIREDRAAALVVATELASATATARLLAVLPLGVLLVGHGAGGDPVGFLVRTPPGLACLAVGFCLGVAGLVWMERIADGVRRA